MSDRDDESFTKEFFSNRFLGKEYFVKYYSPEEGIKKLFNVDSIGLLEEVRVTLYRQERSKDDELSRYISDEDNPELEIYFHHKNCAYSDDYNYVGWKFRKLDLNKNKPITQKALAKAYFILKELFDMKPDFEIRDMYCEIHPFMSMLPEKVIQDFFLEDVHDSFELKRAMLEHGWFKSELVFKAKEKPELDLFRLNEIYNFLEGLEDLKNYYGANFFTRILANSEYLLKFNREELSNLIKMIWKTISGFQRQVQRDDLASVRDILSEKTEVLDKLKRVKSYEEFKEKVEDNKENRIMFMLYNILSILDCLSQSVNKTFKPSFFSVKNIIHTLYAGKDYLVLNKLLDGLATWEEFVSGKRIEY